MSGAPLGESQELDETTFLTNALGKTTDVSQQDDFDQTSRRSTAAELDPERSATADPESGADRQSPSLGISGMSKAASSSSAAGGDQSARKRELISEAQLRAEHQADARLHMLRMADALEEASVRRKGLEAQLVEEQQVAVKLGEELTLWQPRLDKAMLSTKLLSEENSTLEIRLKAQELEAEEERQRSAELQSELSALRSQSGAHLEEIKALKEEFEKERQEMAKLLEAEKLVWKEWEKKAALKELEIPPLHEKIRLLEEEKLALLAKIEVIKKEHFDQLGDLYIQLEQKDALLAEKDAALANIKPQIVIQKETIPEAAVKVEVKKDDPQKAKMQAQIKLLQAELQEALTLAKHLRALSMRSSKGGGGGFISAEKFSELIIQLEEMKAKMGQLGEERDRERETSFLLKSQLNDKRRTAELERQFLPLLHKVTGPIGPCHPSMKKKQSLTGLTNVTNPLDGKSDMQASPDKRHMARTLSQVDMGMNDQSGLDLPSRMSSSAGAGYGGGPLGF